eukprot:13135972-Heterocapsa_arctica.AAC.1
MDIARHPLGAFFEGEWLPRAMSPPTLSPDAAGPSPTTTVVARCARGPAPPIPNLRLVADSQLLHIQSCPSCCRSWPVDA